MQFLKITPHAELRPFIHSYLILEGQFNPEEETFGRLLPDGMQKLIFHFGDHFLEKDGTEKAKQEHCFLHGQLTSYIDIKPTGKIAYLSVHFHPHGLAAFTQTPLNAITTTRISPYGIWGKAGDQLAYDIFTAKGHLQRAKVLDIFFRKQLESRPNPNMLARKAMELLKYSHGQMSVKELADAFGKSTRTIERTFAQHIGTTPKHLSRILRLQYLMRVSLRQPELSLTELTYIGGYYDQSHFIFDFHKVSGQSPKSFFQSDEGADIVFLNRPYLRRLEHYEGIENHRAKSFISSKASRQYKRL